MVYQLRIYVCMHSPGYICLGLVLGRLPWINLFGVHYCVICCVVETKWSNFYTGSWKGSTGRVANWLLEKPDISGVCSYDWKKLRRETFERSCRLSASMYCLWSNGINIFNRINGSLHLGLSFGGYRVRWIATCICVSRERLGEGNFSLDEKNSHTISAVYASLHQTNRDG